MRPNHPTDPGLVSSVVADDGLVDSLVGDAIVDPLLGDDGAAAPVTDAVAAAVDDVTGTTAGTTVVDALVGDDSALDDVVGDGALVEGGTVGNVASNVDAVLDDVAAGDTDAAVTDIGTTIEDLGTDIGQTVTDAAANTDDQVIDDLVGGVLTDVVDVLDGVGEGEDPLAGVDDLVQNLGGHRRCDRHHRAARRRPRDHARRRPHRDPGHAGGRRRRLAHTG